MTSEAAVQQHVRLALAEMNALAWRNNSGAYQDAAGRFVRYGLCNDSAALNATLKSSDLVGVVPLLITPAHVGRTVGIFAAVECKPSDWHLTPGDKRGQAQLRFIELVRSVGGIGCFATKPDDVHQMVSAIR